MKKKITYKDSGSILIGEFLRGEDQTLDQGRLAQGDDERHRGFGGLFHLDISKNRIPCLSLSTDGVGTKLKIAQMMDKHDTVGIDLSPCP